MNVMTKGYSTLQARVKSRPQSQPVGEPLPQTVVRPRPTRVEVLGAPLDADHGGRGTTPPSATQGRPIDANSGEEDDALTRAESLQKTTAARAARVRTAAPDNASNPSGGPLGWMWAQLEQSRSDKGSTKKR